MLTVQSYENKTVNVNKMNSLLAILWEVRVPSVLVMSYAVDTARTFHTVSEVCAGRKMAAATKAVYDYLCLVASIKLWSVQGAGPQRV
jgi:hypoxanthine-guanine phosphoribosyltransferase